MRRLDLVAFAKQGAPPAIDPSAPRLREVPLDLGEPSVADALRARESAFND
jgi:hypothetical protein